MGRRMSGGRIGTVVLGLALLLVSGLLSGVPALEAAPDGSSAKRSGAAGSAPNVAPSRGRILARGPTAVARRTTVVGASQGLTALQLAGRYGMTYTDAINHVKLVGRDGLVLRLYPGTPDVIVFGRRVELKVRIERDGRDIRIPPKAVAYLSRRINTERASRAEQSAAQAKPRVPTYVPKPRAKPVVVPAPKPRTIVAKPQRAPDRAWLPRTTERSWKYIVVHHSDDVRGNAAKYDRIHRETNGWDSLGYHFVIGNGTLSRDGEIEVGPRWPIQKHGAHARNHSLGHNNFNEQGIGICLVGDFHNTRRGPSAKQLAELVRLTRWLMKRYDIAPENVVRHCDCCATECPGKDFPWNRYKARLKGARPIPAEPASR